MVGRGRVRRRDQARLSRQGPLPAVVEREHLVDRQPRGNPDHGDVTGGAVMCIAGVHTPV